MRAPENRLCAVLREFYLLFQNPGIFEIPGFWNSRSFQYAIICRLNHHTTTALMSTRKCLYCDQEKSVAEFSLEHIFPDAIGGSIFSDVFKTRDVCKRCNSICGLFIDGLFIKNFFSQHDRANSYLSFVNFDCPVALPLHFMGVLVDSPAKENEVCEVWFGPHGGIVYHIRQKADSRYDTMIGGNPIDTKKNGGTVFIFAQHPDLYWNEVLLLSCARHFVGARKISGNIVLSLESEHERYFDDPVDDDIISINFFRSISGKEHHVQFKIQIGFEQRFIAKLALGLGYKLFGSKFLATEHAHKLRNAMWEKKLETREQIIGFTNYFASSESNVPLFSWDGIHTLLLYPALSNDTLHLVFSCFGRKLLGIPICDQREIWEPTISSEGVIYIAAPQISCFAGPLNFIDYINHRIGNDSLSELEEIEKSKFDISQLPKITDYL
jgi:HNH endonuclease